MQPSGPAKERPSGCGREGEGVAPSPLTALKALCQHKASHEASLFPRLSSAHRGTGQACTWATALAPKQNQAVCRVALQ